jgi:tagatose-6-phosphate ketose/aldose isomerase
VLSTMLADQGWLDKLSTAEPEVAEILSRPPEEQLKRGYFHTLREICQQPPTWIRTAVQMISSSDVLRECTEGVRAIVLTGSGSSEFVGHCASLGLRRDLNIMARVVPGGTLLTYGTDALPPERPALVVSLSRSGDSPETVGAILRCLQEDRRIRHLVLTCNPEGRAADTFRGDNAVRVMTLDEATNDRSLAMTSSVTNLVLAARSLGALKDPQAFRATCAKLSSLAEQLLRSHIATCAAVARTGFRRAVYLGSGSQLGAARESALKMLEMTAGSVATLRDSFLGFRHGPMSFAHPNTLIVCFLSSDPLLRAYEWDLLQELNDKDLGLLKVLVGEDVPKELARRQDVVLECAGLKELGDDNVPVIHVIVGQLLAFFRCLEAGLRPDLPSEDGVINRVVQSFKLHLPNGRDGKPSGENGTGV